MKHLFCFLNLVLILAITTNVFAQCNLTISLTDTFGDGWNDGEITVSIDGVAVPALTGITLAAGYGPEDYTFSVNPGDDVTVERTNDGDYPGEMRVEVINEYCRTLYGITQPLDAGGATFVANCTSENPEYTLVGNATSTSPFDCVELTQNTTNQRGCAWQRNTVLDFGADFTYDLTVNLGSDTGGADGLCFVVQNDPDGLCACGGAGGGMGAQGITKSLIVEIDTYLNSEDRDDGLPDVVCTDGPSPNHMDIWLNGAVNPAGGACPGSPGARIIASAQPLLDDLGNPYLVANGNDHTLRITWNSGTTTFTAELMENNPGAHSYAVVSHSFDPMTVFETNTPFFGFTASTGGLSNLHSFCLPPVLLPVELKSFNAICTDEETILLTWVTYSELNNEKFIIEKTTNLELIHTVTEKQGAGNSTSTMHYSFEDNAILDDISYYRLKQIDYSGVVKTYPWISVECSSKINKMKIHPIPNNGMFTLTLPKNMHDEEIKIIIFDPSGRLVKNVVLPIENRREIELDCKDLSQGSYHLSILNKNRFENHQLILVK
jgi:hypothetical protein